MFKNIQKNVAACESVRVSNAHENRDLIAAHEGFLDIFKKIGKKISDFYDRTIKFDTRRIDNSVRDTFADHMIPHRDYCTYEEIEKHLNDLEEIVRGLFAVVDFIEENTNTTIFSSGKYIEKLASLIKEKFSGTSAFGTIDVYSGNGGISIRFRENRNFHIPTVNGDPESHGWTYDKYMAMRRKWVAMIRTLSYDIIDKIDDIQEDVEESNDAINGGKYKTDQNGEVITDENGNKVKKDFYIKLFTEVPEMVYDLIEAVDDHMIGAARPFWADTIRAFNIREDNLNKAKSRWLTDYMRK